MRYLTLTLSLILGLATSVSADINFYTLLKIDIVTQDFQNLDSGWVGKNSVQKSLYSSFFTDDKKVVSFRSLDSCRSQLQSDVMTITSNKLQKPMRLELIVNNTLDEEEPSAILKSHQVDIFHYFACQATSAPK